MPSQVNMLLEYLNWETTSSTSSIMVMTAFGDCSAASLPTTSTLVLLVLMVKPHCIDVASMSVTAARQRQKSSCGSCCTLASLWCVIISKLRKHKRDVISVQQDPHEPFCIWVPAMHELAINLVRHLDPKFVQLRKHLSHCGVQTMLTKSGARVQPCLKPLSVVSVALKRAVL